MEPSEIWEGLIKALPSAVLMLIGLAMIGFGSVGKFWGGDLDSKTKAWLIFWGKVLFYIGSIITTMMALSTLVDIYKLSLLWNDVRIFWYWYRYYILFGLIIAGGLYWWWPSISATLKSVNYSIDANTVLDNPTVSRRETLYGCANLLVENIGSGDLKLVAKLAHLERLDEREQRLIPLREINPRSYYLRWDDGRASVLLTKQRPRSIIFVDSYEMRGYTGYGRVLLEQDEWRPLEKGSYLVHVDIFRVESLRHVKMRTVRGNLILYSNDSRLYCDWQAV